jgi:hypothetical protein
MPTIIPVDKMARGKANTKRKSTANTTQTPVKEPCTASGPSADLTEPPRANLKDPPPAATTALTAEAATASVATLRTTNTTASGSTRMPPHTVHVPPVPGGGGEHETTTNDLTKATEATTAAYGGQDSAFATNLQMTFTIRNYVTQHFFPYVNFITKKEKLAFYPPGTNPASYCAIITRGCNLPRGTNLAKWWETVAKRVVKKN